MTFSSLLKDFRFIFYLWIFTTINSASFVSSEKSPSSDTVLKCPSIPSHLNCECNLKSTIRLHETINQSGIGIMCQQLHDISDWYEILDAIKETNLLDPNNRALPQNSTIYIDLYIQSSNFKTLGSFMPSNVKEYQQMALRSLYISFSDFVKIELDAFNSVANTLVSFSFHDFYFYQSFHQNVIAQFFTALPALKNLRVLNLHMVDLIILNATIFKSFPRLRSLTIVSSISLIFNDQMLGELSELRDFFLKSKLRYIPRSILKLQHLENFVFQSRGLSKLDSALFLNAPKNLSFIDLSQSGLSKINSDTFKAVTKLNKLDLSNNQLTVLPSSSICPRQNNISYLSLDGNLLTTISRSMITNCIHLTTFSAVLNHLKKVPFDLFIDSQDTLRSISFKSNNISDFNLATLAEMPNLTILDFSNNKLRRLQIPHYFYTSKLESINLGSNRLDGFDPKQFFSSVDTLRYVYLDRNRITKFDFESLEMFNKLNRLELSRNKLESIEGLPELAISKPKLIQSISLTDNPIRCDCEVLKLNIWFYNDSGLEKTAFPTNLLLAKCKDQSNQTHSLLDESLINLLTSKCPNVTTKATDIITAVITPSQTRAIAHVTQHTSITSYDITSETTAMSMTDMSTMMHTTFTSTEANNSYKHNTSQLTMAAFKQYRILKHLFISVTIFFVICLSAIIIISLKKQNFVTKLTPLKNQIPPIVFPKLRKDFDGDTIKIIDKDYLADS